MSDDAAELTVVTLVLAGATLYLAHRWRAALPLTAVMFLPAVLVLLLGKLAGWPPVVSLVAGVLVLPVATCFVHLIEGQGISTSAHVVIADTSMATMAICCTVPALVAWTRLGDASIPGVLFVLGFGGAILAYEAHRIANQCRALRWAPTHRVQVRLLTLFVITALAAMLIVFPVVGGTVMWFIGASVYWSGCGLLAAKWNDRLRRERREDGVQRLTGTSTVMIGLSYMLLGIASVAAAF